MTRMHRVLTHPLPYRAHVHVAPALARLLVMPRRALRTTVVLAHLGDALMVALTLILGVVVVHASPLSFLGPDWRGVYVTSPRRRRDLGASTEKHDRQLRLAILSHFPNGAKIFASTLGSIRITSHSRVPRGDHLLLRRLLNSAAPKTTRATRWVALTRTCYAASPSSRSSSERGTSWARVRRRGLLRHTRQRRRPDGD